jgi:hypothetical protein
MIEIILRYKTPGEVSARSFFVENHLAKLTYVFWVPGGGGDFKNFIRFYIIWFEGGLKIE